MSISPLTSAHPVSQAAPVQKQAPVSVPTALPSPAVPVDKVSISVTAQHAAVSGDADHDGDSR